MYYIVTFHLENSADYDEIYKKFINIFSKSCLILPTTYLVKSDESIKTIKNWFKNIVNEDHISILVTKFDKDNYSMWLDKTVIKNIEKLIR